MTNVVRNKMKDRQNETRVYDDEGFLMRAACICVKNESENDVLLVTSGRHLDRWIVPGGGVEPDESHTVAAVREVIEEAGVRGKIDRCLGVFENEERRTRTAVYVMIVTEEMPEWDDSKKIGRMRKWFSFDEAIEKLAISRPIQLDYLERMRLKNKRNQQTEDEAAPT